ncbi:hypothetical protein [Vibrio alginolyticus]|uniref:hypothetical protein n=1 Tax=Vibrio alginolyticus TaxID=663 RepID=UPI00211A65A8|nr:hypothetical protein [Vibrio alginolyticus]MCQ9087402.1 Rrf2 family transcriptional regulator [Vibrio alginolyticus]
MKITVEHEGDVIWARDTESNQGTACTAYTKDGTQEKIIAALESALEQAKGELLCRNN